MSTRRRIILHWTAGLLYPNTVDLKHYHFAIDGDALVHKGLCKIADNDNCYDGRYAAHTGGGNTRSIGVAVCGMRGFVSKANPGDQLLTRKQVEKMFSLSAELLREEGYSKVTAENCMTHYEFGKLHPETSSAGKIDITYLPPFPELFPEDIGHFIRRKTQWYLERLIARGF
jgi:hypothetical protein